MKKVIISSENFLDNIKVILKRRYPKSNFSNLTLKLAQRHFGSICPKAFPCYVIFTGKDREGGLGGPFFDIKVKTFSLEELEKEQLWLKVIIAGLIAEKKCPTQKRIKIK